MPECECDHWFTASGRISDVDLFDFHTASGATPPGDLETLTTTVHDTSGAGGVIIWSHQVPESTMVIAASTQFEM